MVINHGNRTVTGLFQAWGTAESCPPFPVSRGAETFPMHAGERNALALIVPASLFVIAWSFLRSLMAWPVAVAAAFFATIIFLHAILLLSWLRSPRCQWFVMLAGMLVWAVFHSTAGGVTAWVAWLWITIGVIEVAGWLWIASNATGRPGAVFRFLGLLAAFVGCGFIGWQFGWLAGFLAANAFVAACLWSVLNPACSWWGPITREFTGNDILLTIDDGPDDDTLELLDLLDAANAKAVFFVIGAKVRARPDLARVIVARGYQLGNHTDSHPQASFWCAGPWRTAREIEQCSKAIIDVTGVAPVWFRAPVGHRNPFTHPIARAMGMNVMGWNCRGYDAVESDIGKITAKLLPAMKPGGIVLLHQGRAVSRDVLQAVLQRRIELLSQG
ncbi:MAG: polysaccharide deacetylase family protein [Verrucomicrobiota bacterium]